MNVSDLRQMYVPVKNQRKWNQLLQFASRLRTIEPRDEGEVGKTFLMIESRGEGSRESFQDFKLIKADVGHVGGTFSEIWIRCTLTVPSVTMNKPVKFANDSKKYLVFE